MLTKRTTTKRRELQPAHALDPESDSSSVIESVDTSSSMGSEFSALPSGAKIPAMRQPPAAANLTEAGAGAGAGSAAALATLPVSDPAACIVSSDTRPPALVVRTSSVKRGWRASYGVFSLTSADGTIPAGARRKSFDEFDDRRVVDGRKSLKRELAQLVGGHPHVYIDLSHNWAVQERTAGARAAAAAGLLGAGSGKHVTIDLSNHRLADLREGARLRCQQGLKGREWRKATTDDEAPQIVDALGREISRASRQPADMPDFELICHDQPLFTIVYPLVRKLSRHAASLPGLKKLDLNRYSRSGEVGEAWNGPGELANFYALLIDELACLLAGSTSLRELGLRMSGLDADSLMTLAGALTLNASLQQIDLSCNPLCRLNGNSHRASRGLRALARMLERNTKLRRLDLSFCGIDDKRASALLPGLKANRTLEHVDLGGNPVASDHPVFLDPRVRRERTTGQ